MGGLSGHPNIVNILRVGVTESGRPYIVMPYMAADSLAVRLRREGPVPWPEALRIGVKLCGALETAHKSGTLHRDIKPANVLINDYGEPQLSDFGIAHIEGGYETATGFFSGTIDYTAPEVMTGSPATVASDLYSLGATIYALIAGSAAHERKNDEDLVAQYLRISTTRVPDMRPEGIPDAVCAAIEHAMSIEPAQRPASAAEFGRELQSVQRSNGLRPDSMAITETGHESGSTGILYRMSRRRRPSPPATISHPRTAWTSPCTMPRRERQPFRRRNRAVRTNSSRRQAFCAACKPSRTPRPRHGPNRPAAARESARRAVRPAAPEGGSGRRAKSAIASRWSPVPPSWSCCWWSADSISGCATTTLRRALPARRRPRRRRRRGSRSPMRGWRATRWRPPRSTAPSGSSEGFAATALSARCRRVTTPSSTAGRAATIFRSPCSTRRRSAGRKTRLCWVAGKQWAAKTLPRIRFGG